MPVVSNTKLMNKLNVDAKILTAKKKKSEK